MTYKGIFVDDQELVYAETLSSRGHLKFQPQGVEEVAVLARKIFSETPIIVAIDYRLDEAPEGLQTDQTYKGSALGQHLRDACIERPENDFALVLVSAESKIRSLYRPDKTAHDLFDRVYVKEEINERRAVIRRELISLCSGYEKLRAALKRYDIVDLMGGADSDRPYIEIQEIRTKIEEAAAPHVVARVLFGLIDHPGPLLNTAGACAYLGIDPYGCEAITGILQDAGINYTGIFSEAWPRWWANRLETWSHNLFGRRATGLPASDRARLLSERFKIDLKPAQSPWNQSPDELISFACASCERGTELRHSVAAFVPAQARHMIRPRICWDCIQTDKYEDVAHSFPIDDSDKELAQKIKAKERSRDQVGGTTS